MLGYNAVNYVSRNADTILVGRVLGADALGLYSRAYNLFMMPILNIVNPVLQVGLPALSRLAEVPERFAKYYLNLLAVVALLTVPLATLSVLEGAFLIRVILGPQWSEAAPIFRLLSLAGIVQPAVATTSIVQLSLGESRRYLSWGAASTLVIVASIVVGLRFGAVGVAGSYAIANYLLLVPAVHFCLRNSPVRAAAFYRELGAAVLAAQSLARLLLRLKRRCRPDGLRSMRRPSASS